MGGKGFLHIAVDHAVGIVDLGNAQMILVLGQVMVNGVLFAEIGEFKKDFLK